MVYRTPDPSPPPAPPRPPRGHARRAVAILVLTSFVLPAVRGVGALGAWLFAVGDPPPRDARPAVDVAAAPDGPAPIEHVAALFVDRGRLCATTEAGETFCHAPSPDDHRRPNVLRRRVGPAPVAPAATSPADPVGGLPPTSQVIALNNIACAVAAGEVWCWRTPVQTGFPQAPAFKMAFPGVVRRIAGHDRTLCALVGRDEIRCEELTLHRDFYPEVRGTPSLVRADDARDLAVVRDGACVLQSTGRVRCWGSRADAVPTGANPYHASFHAVSGLPPVARIALTDAYACAVTRGGEMWCWGANESHQIDDARVDRPTAHRVEGLAGVARVSVSDQYACVLGVRGSTSCWGYMGFGVWMYGDEAPVAGSSEGPPPLAPGGTVRELAVGRNGGACTIDASGLRCHRVGARDTPLAHPPSGPLRELTPSGDGFCAREGAQSVVCWNVPAWTEAPHVYRRRVRDLAALLPGRTDESCARTVDGALVCWRGDGLSYPRLNALPGGVVGLDPATVAGAAEVARADDFVCVRRHDGGVVCAGRNDRGQQGDGSPSPDVVADAIVAP